MNSSFLNVELPAQKPPFPVIDGHVDLLYAMMRHWPGIPFSDLAEGPITAQTLGQGNVRILVSAFYCEDVYNGPRKALSRLHELLAYTDRYLGGLKVIKSGSDLHDCYPQGKGRGTLFLLENADALLDADLSEMRTRGFLVVGLTHAGRNRLADGNGVKSPGGLTVRGRQMVRDLARQGFVMDVAHLSEPGFWEAVDIFEGPLISSHTGFRRFCDTPRNLSDKQVKALMARKGVVGVTVNPEMLSPDQQADITGVFEQFDWMVQTHGIDGAAVGSDFGGFEGETRGLEHYGRLDQLANLLAQHGYPEHAISKIMGENWHRLYAAKLPPQARPPS